NTGIGAGGADGGDVDDGSAAVLFHIGQGLFHHIINGILVGGDHLVPQVVVAVGDGHALVVDTGVVDEDIDTAKVLNGGLHQFAAVFAAAHVGGDGHGPHALFLGIFFHFLQLVQPTG